MNQRSFQWIRFFFCLIFTTHVGFGIGLDSLKPGSDDGPTQPKKATDKETSNSKVKKVTSTGDQAAPPQQIETSPKDMEKKALEKLKGGKSQGDEKKAEEEEPKKEKVPMTPFWVGTGFSYAMISGVAGENGTADHIPSVGFSFLQSLTEKNLLEYGMTFRSAKVYAEQGGVTQTGQADQLEVSTYYLLKQEKLPHYYFGGLALGYSGFKWPEQNFYKKLNDSGFYARIGGGVELEWFHGIRFSPSLHYALLGFQGLELGLHIKFQI